MPLPILAVIALGALGGTAAAKGTSQVRHWMNDGEVVRAKCSCCGNMGPHKFAMIDRSWAAGGVIGALTGGAGGTVAGLVAKRIFSCRECGSAMYDNGERPSWNADQAIDAFIRYPELRRAHEELQSLIARNQHVASRYSDRIKALERDLALIKGDNAKLKMVLRRMRDLNEQMRRDGV